MKAKVVKKAKSKKQKKITLSGFKGLLALQTAKQLGFKSIAEATKSGYNCKRVCANIKELKNMYKIDENTAEDIISEWKSKDLCTYSRVCGLNTIYFRNN